MPPLAHRGDADFDEVTNDLLDIATDVADFGEFGRFNLQERGLGELCETPRDFRFANAGRSNHQDVLWQDFFPQGRGKLLASPAIAQRDGYGALGCGLSDNVTIQFRDDFPRGECAHGFA